MDELVIKEILSVDLNVITKNGEHHTLSFMDLYDHTDGSSMSFNIDDYISPKCNIDIHLECDEFTCKIDTQR